jgi:hypothetical protein
MTKKIIEKHSSPYDLSTKGGFKRQSASSTNSKPRTPYDLNRAVRRNPCSNGFRTFEKNN